MTNTNIRGSVWQMEFKQVYYCRCCNSWYELNPEESLRGCEKCGEELKYVPVSYKAYSEKSPEEKQKFQQAYLNAPPEEENPIQEEEPESEMDKIDGGWSRLGGCLRGILVYFLVALTGTFVFHVGNGVLRNFHSYNQVQKKAEIHMNALIENGEDLPVGEYVDLEVRWVLGPYATYTQTRERETDTQTLSAVIKEVNYYYVVLENNTIMSVATANASEKETLDRMSDWMLNAAGLPKDGETLLLQGKLTNMENAELIRLFLEYADDLFGLDPDSPALHKLVLDTEAGREGGEILASGLVVVIVAAIVCFIIYKKKKKQEKAFWSSDADR